MSNKAHRTPSTRKSKSAPVVADNRQKRSPDMISRLVKLGVPTALAPEFPLGPHPSGRWCKKIKGTVYFFGKLADSYLAAFDRYKAERDDLFAGRKPASRNTEGLRLLDLCNQFLHYKRGLIQTGELTMRTWHDYHLTGERLLSAFGQDRLVTDLGPPDFERLRAEFAKTWGPVKIGNEVTRSKMYFTYAFEMGLIDKPIRYGPSFEKPDRKAIRRARKAKGPRMFEAPELRTIIDAADPCMKAMVLLAANGGLGNHDVATLPMTALDMESGWLDFPRPKTEVDRKIPLWNETIAAIKAWLAVRPEPKRPEDAPLLFLTKQRFAWSRSGRIVKEEDGSTAAKGFSSPVSVSFKIVLDRLGINGHRGFYAIRHGFETIGGDTGDQVAVNAIMGHADHSMAGHYRERIDPERLRKVTEHVRSWLFGKVPNSA
jgi:integrase